MPNKHKNDNIEATSLIIGSIVGTVGSALILGVISGFGSVSLSFFHGSENFFPSREESVNLQMPKKEHIRFGSALSR